MDICPLSADLRSLLRTGVALTSVTQCVEELVLNSLDAEATCIAVRLDLPSFKIQVVDNGVGIPTDQLKKIGERYSTSKCHNIEDLNNLTYFGYRGEALSSLRDLSSILEVTSRPKHSTLTYCKLFQQGRPLPVIESSIPRPSAGTTVTAHDLFYNFPVRKKSLSESLEFERVRQRIEAIALMKPSVSITLRNDATGSVVLQTHKTNSVFNAFTSLFGMSRAKMLSKVDLSTEKFVLTGFIGKEGFSRKDLQFVYVNGRLVLKTRIHKLLNNILAKSLILRKKGSTNSSNSTGKNITPPLTSSPTKFSPRYAVFVLNIECPHADYDITFEPAKTLVEFKSWDVLCSCVEKLVNNFLIKENVYVGIQPLQSQLTERREDDKEQLSEEDNVDGDDTNDKKDKDTNETSPYAWGIRTCNSKNFLTSKSAKRPIPDSVKPSGDSEQRSLTSSISEEEAPVQNDGDHETQTEPVFTTPPITSPSTVDPAENCENSILSSSDDQNDLGNGDTGESEEYETEDPFVKLADLREKKKAENVSMSHVVPAQSKTFIHIPTPYISCPGGSILSRFRNTSKKESKSTDCDWSERNLELAPGFSLKKRIIEMRKEKDLTEQKLKHKKTSHVVEGEYCSIAVRETDKKGTEIYTKETEARTREKTSMKVQNNFEQRAMIPLEENLDNTKICEDLSMVDTRILKKKSSDEMVLEETKNTPNEAFTFLSKKSTNEVDKYTSVATKIANSMQNRSVDERVCNSEKFRVQVIERSDDAIGLLKLSSTYAKEESDSTPHTMMANSVQIENSKVNRVLLSTASLVQTPRTVFKNIVNRNADKELKRISLASKLATKCRMPENRSSLFDTTAKCSYESSDFTINHRGTTKPLDCDSENGRLSKALCDLPFRNPTLLGNTQNELNHTLEQTISEGNIGTIEQSMLDTENNNRDLFCYETFDCSSPPQDKIQNVEQLPFEDEKQQNITDNSQGFSPCLSTSQEQVFGLIVPESEGFEIESSGWKEDQDYAQFESQGFVPVPHFSVTNRTASPAGSEGFSPILSDGEISDRESPHHVVEKDVTKKTGEFLSLNHFLDSSSSSIAELYSEDERVEKSSFQGNRKRKNFVSSEDSRTKDSKQTKFSKANPDGYSSSNQSANILGSSNQYSDILFSSNQSSVCDTEPESSLKVNCDKNLMMKLQDTPVTSDDYLSLDLFATAHTFTKDLPNCNDVSPRDAKQEISQSSVLRLDCDEKFCDKVSVINPEETNNSTDKSDVTLNSTCEDCERSVNTVSQFVKTMDSTLEQSTGVTQGKLSACEMDSSKTPGQGTESVLSSQWSDMDENELAGMTYTDQTGAHQGADKSESTPTEDSDGETWIEMNDPKTGNNNVLDVKSSNNCVDALSPQSHNALVQMVQDHFEKDEDQDDLASVKWKDNKRDSYSSNTEQSADINVESLFRDWQNPVFEATEQALKTTETTQQGSRTSNRAQQILNPCKFSKEMFTDLKVIGQVDKKFIACLTRSETESHTGGLSLMVLFDQHAADERVRLERFTNDAYVLENGKRTNSLRKFEISPAHSLQLTREEVRMLLSFQAEFNRIGIECSELPNCKDTVSVHTIPACIMEREVNEVKQIRDSVGWHIVECLIREHVELLRRTGGAHGTFPQTLHKCMCSQACHGAIKFGDSLSIQKCEQLLQALGKCNLPFQCAHGRPSITPLLHVDKVQKPVATDRPSLWKISRHVQPQ